MKLKIGDKVRIKNNLKEIENFCGGYVSELEKYVGKIFTIESFYRDYQNREGVTLEEIMFTWDKRALEKIVNTKEYLKNGDVVTLRNGDKLLFNGEDFWDLSADNNNGLCDINELDDNLKFEDIDGYKEKYDIIKIERVVKYETIFERENEILDDVEREYLYNLIKPFRKDVKYIKKYKYASDKEYIIIQLKEEHMILPNFKKDSMYKGMEIGKEYTLEELCLDKVGVK